MADTVATTVKKPTAVVVAASVCIALTGMAAAGAANAQETKIALGMSGWTGFAPLSLADKAGIFKKNGLTEEIRAESMAAV